MMKFSSTPMNKSPHQNRLGQFVRLAVPATLALGSDFWRMSAIGLLAGLRIINFKNRWEMWKKYVKPSSPKVLMTLCCKKDVFGIFWDVFASLVAPWIGTLGGSEVAVFNASYRVAWMNLTIIGAFSSACTTQLGIALGCLATIGGK